MGFWPILVLCGCNYRRRQLKQVTNPVSNGGEEETQTLFFFFGSDQLRIEDTWPQTTSLLSYSELATHSMPSPPHAVGLPLPSVPLSHCMIWGSGVFFSYHDKKTGWNTLFISTCWHQRPRYHMLVFTSSSFDYWTSNQAPLCFLGIILRLNPKIQTWAVHDLISACLPACTLSSTYPP